MATLPQIRTYVRESIYEYRYKGLSDDELDRIINDAFLDVSSKMLCFEETQVLAPTSRFVEFTGYKVKYVDLLIYLLGVYQETRTLQKIRPEAVGFVPSNDDHPQWWFQFGNLIVLDPSLNSSYTYTLSAIVATYPGDTTPGYLLTESGNRLTTESGNPLTVESAVPYLHYDVDTTDGFTRTFVDTAVDFAIAYASMDNANAFRLSYNRYISRGVNNMSIYVDPDPDKRLNRQIPKVVK